MSHLLGDAGRAFLKAFLSSLLVVAIGISQQTNFNNAVALGIAGLMAAFAAGLAAIQVFVPEFSFRAHVPDPWGPMVDSFFHAAVGAFIVAVIGMMNEPNFSAWHSLIIAAIVGAINAGLRAIQGGLTVGEAPSPATGIPTTDLAARRTKRGATAAPTRRPTVLLPA